MYYQRYNNNGNFLGLMLLMFLIFGGFRILFLLFGIAVALIINFFPLIIMGYATYYIVKKIGRNRGINNVLNSRTSDHKRFVELMVHIMMHIAKADGTISESEVQMMRQFFIQQLNFSGAKIEWLNDTIATAKKSPESIQILAKEFTNQFGYESQLMLLNMLYNVAYADGKLHEEETRQIDQLAVLLNISAFDHQRIKMAFEAQFGDIASQANTDKYFATLGIPNHSSQEEIKKAYRDLTKKYHPDKVQHLGEEFKDQAEKRMQEINAAYDEIMKQVVA